MPEDVILSPQEERINSEINNKSEGINSKERVNNILNTFKGTRPKIDIERGLYFTQSFKETEGEPLILRWSKALLHYAQNSTIYIDDDQLIVGRGGKQGRYGLLYPELDGDFLDEAINELPKGRLHLLIFQKKMQKLL